MNGTGRDVTSTVVWIAFGLLAAEVAGGLVQNYGGYLGDVMAARMREILSTRYYAKLLGLPTRYYDEQVTGTIISRLTRSITEVTTFLNSFANNFFPMLLTVVAVLAVSAAYYWPLAVLLAIIFPTYFWLTALTSTRFYRSTSGHVRVAGQDVEDVPSSALRAHVGVVFQDASLFSGTIRENISYGRPQASEQEIAAAAKRAYAHDFIRQFAAGYDSTIGERGLKLSGGQKQRIAVARAILKDAPILVLDEATSALDTKSERLVQRGLDELMAGRSSLIIAHRLSTISTVDLIVTLRDGRVEEAGKPDELATSGGIYSELLGLQASASRHDRKRLKEYGFTA